jgi:hypothetical protein
MKILLLLISITFIGNSFILDDFENRYGTNSSTNYAYGSWYLYDDQAKVWSQRDYIADEHRYDDKKGYLQSGSSKFITPLSVGKDTIKSSNGSILRIENIYPAERAVSTQDSSSVFRVTGSLSTDRPAYEHISEDNPDPTYGGFFGFGTSLNPNNISEKLTENMEIRFDASFNIEKKAPIADTLWVEFVIKTDQEVIREHDSYYRVQFPVSFNESGESGLQNYSFSLSNGIDKVDLGEKKQFHQPSWLEAVGDTTGTIIDYWGWEAEDSADYLAKKSAAPNWNKTLALEWQISTDIGDNINFASDTTSISITIDNISISDFTPSSFKMSGKESWVVQDSSAVSDKKRVAASNNPFSIYSYQSGDSSDNLVLTEDLMEENSYFLEFFEKKNDSVDFYAGVSQDLNGFDDSSHNGISIKYKTTFEYLEIFLLDSTSIAMERVGFSQKIVGTNGEWQEIEIPFDNFYTPWWSDRWSDNSTPLSTSNLKTINIEYTGNSGDTGTVAIDSIFFVSDIEDASLNFTGLKELPKERFFKLTVSEMSAILTLPTGVEKATVDLLSLNGALELSNEVENSSEDILIDLSSLEEGVHVLKINSILGDEFTEIRAVSLVK